MTLLAYKPGHFMYYGRSGHALVFTSYRDGVYSAGLPDEQVLDCLALAASEEAIIRPLNAHEQSLLAEAKVAYGAGRKKKKEAKKAAKKEATKVPVPPKPAAPEPIQEAAPPTPPAPPPAPPTQEAAPPKTNEAPEKKKGVLNWLSDLFVDKDKKAKKDELQKFLRENYGKLGALTKQIEQNEKLASFLTKSVETGTLDADAIAAMSELFRRDKDWVSHFSLDTSDLTPELSVPLKALHSYVTEPEFTMSKNALEKSIMRTINEHVTSSADRKIEIDVAEKTTSQPGERVVNISSDMGTLLAIMKEFEIEPKDLLHKL